MPDRKRIMLVGEAFGEREEAVGRPFVGPSGKLLDAFLAAAGMARQECYITNVLNLRPPGNKLLALCGSKAEGIPAMPALQKGKHLRAEFKPELDRLYQEIRNVDPNLIIALGGTACWALLRNGSIKKLRGAPIESPITGHKVLPTYHPAAVLRDFKLRPIVFSDFKKAARQADYPEVRRPRRELWLHPSIDDLERFEHYILRADRLSVDIETWNRQITCIGFAPSHDRALVIPFIWHGRANGNYWPDLDSEMIAWGYVKKWLNLGIPLVGQNLLYDLNYLWAKYGLRIGENYQPGDNAPPPVEDTMLLHHSMQPEMEKSLAFLGSLYSDEPQWKFMRADVKTLKKED